MQYKDYLRTDDWRKKRAEKRAVKNRCAICSSDDVLDVHHLNYRNLFDVLQSDLRVLCRQCHFLTHDLMKAGVIRFRPNSSHQAKFSLIKARVKKAYGLSRVNLFYPKKPVKKQKPTYTPVLL